MTSFVDIARVAGYLSIKQGDTASLNFLTAEIRDISALILSYLGRPFILPQNVTFVDKCLTHNTIILPHWPVGEIFNVTINEREVGPMVNGRDGYFLHPADGGLPGVPQKLTIPHRAFPARVVCKYRAGYEILNEPANFIAQKDPTQQFYYQALAPLGPYGSDSGVHYASGAGDGGIVYSVDPGGVYTVPNQPDSPLTVSYGYIPSAIANAALMWVSERYYYRARGGFSSKTLAGQESVSYPQASFALPPGASQQALQPYKRII